MEIKEIKEKIIETCLWMQEKKLVVGTWGNVSVRSGETIIMTPSRIPYEDMTIDDLVTIDYEGNKIEGFRHPTTEREVHRMIYLARKDVGAVIHCHPQYSSAMCAVGESIPPILEEMTQLVGGEIPTTPEYVNAGKHEELGMAAAKYLGDKNAVLLRNHAPVCCGTDLEEAKTCCEVVEKAAQSYIELKGKFDIKIIPDELVVFERQRFIHKYGKEWA